MTALSQPKPRAHVGGKPTKTIPSYPKSTAAKIWAGAFLTVATGKVEAVDAANEAFAGIAMETREADETHIELAVEGVFETPTAPTGASGTSSVGSAVYLSTDTDTLTLTSSGNASFGGKITAYDATTGKYTISYKSSLL